MVMDNKGLSLLKELLDETKLTVIKIGPCDINICICGLKDLIERVDKYITDTCTQKCTLCENTILLDESYIQNCDGVQHVNCYIGIW